MENINEIYLQKGIKHILENINFLKLDLSNKVILTEIGTNAYFFTPLIALFSGAKHVFIWAKDNQFAKAIDLEDAFKKLAQKYNFTNYEFSINTRNIEHIRQSDIITNLGNIRPIDKKFLSYCKEGAIISLMYDAWEFRPEEIDIDYCKKRNIELVAVNENTTSFPIFISMEQLALKMAFEAGYEIYNNKIIVWSSDIFGEFTKRGFEKNNAKKVILTKNIEIVAQEINDTDFIFLCDYNQNGNTENILNFKKLKEVNPFFGIIHLYGALGMQYFELLNIPVYPRENGRNQFMSKTFAHLGLYPALNLNIAGLKVAQAVLEDKKNELVQMM